MTSIELAAIVMGGLASTAGLLAVVYRVVRHLVTASQTLERVSNDRATQQAVNDRHARWMTEASRQQAVTAQQLRHNTEAIAKMEGQIDDVQTRVARLEGWSESASGSD